MAAYSTDARSSDGAIGGAAVGEPPSSGPGRTTRLEWTFFALALALYLATRLIGLERFPIYFFCDEAVQCDRAEELLHNGMRNSAGELLPTFFANGPNWNLCTSVYLQVVPGLLLGKSVVGARAVPALLSTLAALLLALALRTVFRVRYWWAGVLLLSIAPAWFLHSRTAFEASLMVTFYAAAVFSYLRYVSGSPRWLYAAVACAGLAFYSYTPAQLVVPITATLLLASDWRYHWRNRATVARALLVVALLGVPFARFELAHPHSAGEQLRLRDSPLMAPGRPASVRLARAAGEYLSALSPKYWYLPNDKDLQRHVMKGYGHLLLPTLPFALLGLALCLASLRSPPHRALLAFLLAAPTAAWLAPVLVTRVLAFVVPATMLTAIGLSAFLTWLHGRRVPPVATAVVVVVSLGATAVFMLHDALWRGPLWFRDYGLYGMQYGARQLFGEAIPAILAAGSRTSVVVSPIWANGTDEFARFFLTPAERRRVRFMSLAGYLFTRQRTAPDDLVVFTADEYRLARVNAKLDQVEVERVLPFPDGSPGFYFVRFAYSAEADALFAAEREARRQPVVEEVEMNGQTVTLTHSRFAVGGAADLVDGDPFTLVRGLEANPLALDFAFSRPVPVRVLSLHVGAIRAMSVTISLFAPSGDLALTRRESFTGLTDDASRDLPLAPEGLRVSRARIEISDDLAGESAMIHVRDLAFH